jgi:Flp pilus assembly protein TadD
MRRKLSTTALSMLDPDDARAFDSRGVAYREKREYDRAIHDFDQALRLGIERRASGDSRTSLTQATSSTHPLLPRAMLE